jgi:protein-disulfide isomerase
MATLEKGKKQKVGDTRVPEPRRGISARTWAALVVLGALSALWALFLWMELVVLRSGGSSFCATEGTFDCAPLWNGALATAVHHATGLPISGWGLVWSAVAFGLALAGLLREALGRPSVVLLSSVRLIAAAGVLVVLVMIAASAFAGRICIGCLGTYVLVVAYVVTASRPWRPGGLQAWPRAAGLAAGSALAGYFLLLYPGLHTPESSAEKGRRAVEEAASRPLNSAAEDAAAAADRGTGNPQRDRALTDFVASLDPPMKKTLADSLAIYRASAPQKLPPPRALDGSDLAGVRITEFTDILCEHCASLNETLHELRQSVPPGTYSVDARQFPLDSRCNPLMQSSKGDDVRCVAAKLLICAELSGKEPDLATALFEKQEGLTRKQAIDIASRFLPRASIDGCVDSPATTTALQQDIRSASLFDSDGTPIVAINGRKGTSFAPFLYSIVMARGNADHPAFASLPPGDPTAHLH